MHPALIALGKIAAPLIMKKVSKEVEEYVEGKIGDKDLEEVKSTVKKVEVLELDKKKAGVWSVLIGLITIASSMGYIDTGLAEAIINFLSNPEVQDAVEGAIEGSEAI